MEPIMMSRNVLSKGMNTNIYPSRLPGDFCYELLNAKVYSAGEGSSYIIRNAKGNQERFSISDGFQIIGLREHNKILYIVSENDDGVVELGSYPSPRQMIEEWESYGYKNYRLDEDLTGFENVYKPLPSIYAGLGAGTLPLTTYTIIKGFRTKEFDFDIDRIIYPLSKSSNDNTVNIYMCDGENPNRVVNNCFNEEGVIIKDRLYKGATISEADTEYAIDRITRQFLSISKPPQARLNSVEEGGELPLGNLFVYIRYLDYEFNKSNFTPLLGPIAITNGDDIFTVSGNNPDGNINKSNKRVLIDINYIDMSYKYFEIAIAWKTSNDQVALGERAMLLSKRVPIISSEELSFVITGQEEMLEIGMSEILTPALKETISLAQTTFGDRFWGANWKESTYNKEAMKELAKMVYIEPELIDKNDLIDNDGLSMKDYDLDAIDYLGPAGINKKHWYQSPEFVIDRVGNYRGEVYPYALVGILDDGTYTDPFPITGYDYYNAADLNLNLTIIDDTAYLSNDDNTNNGFVRFPQFGTGDEESNIDDINYILLAKAKMHRFWTYLNNSINTKDGKFDGISGFKIVRGDRFKNLLYHGINLPLVDTVRLPKDDSTTDAWTHFSDPSSVKYDLRLGGQQNREQKNVKNKNALSFPSVDSYPKKRRGVHNPSLPYVREKGNDKLHLDIGFSMGLKSISSRKAIYAPDYLLSNYNRFSDNQNLYYHIPYSQLPHYQPDDYISRVFGHSYYRVSTNILSAEEQLGNSIYQYKFNYSNNNIGRVALNGKLLFGECWYAYTDTSFNTNIRYGASNYCYLEYFRYAFNSEPPYFAYKFVECQTIPIRIDDGLYTEWKISNHNNHYLKVIGTNVPYGAYRHKNNYSSMLGDGYLSSLNIGYHFHMTANNRDIGNRDISSLRYIGLDYADEWAIGDRSKVDSYNDSSMLPVLIYSQPNDNEYYTNLVNRYKPNGIIQLFGIDYKDCSLFIDKNNDRTYTFNGVDNLSFDNLYCNGDCFISRFSFRQSFNRKIYDLYTDEDGAPITSDINTKHYNHGRLFSVVLQSDSNTGLRANTENGFYPHWAVIGWNPYLPGNPTVDLTNYQLGRNSVLCARFGGTNLGLEAEDLVYDWGHSETLPFNKYPGLDEIYKNDEIRYETRVRYTDKSFEEAYIDGWRSMYYLSKADYPNDNGAIMIIGYHGLHLIIAQERGLYQLFPNEKYVSQMQNQSGSEAVVGVGSILPDEYKPLADYGSQHTAFVQTNDYISGYDFNKSIWWKTGTYESGNTAVLGVNPISTNISDYLIKRRKVITNPIIALGKDYDDNDLYLTVNSRVRLSFDAYVNTDGQTVIDLGDDYENYSIDGYVTLYEFIGDDYVYTNVNVYDLYRDTLIIDQDLSKFISNDLIGLYLNYGYTVQQHENLSSKENNFISRAGFYPRIYGTHKNILISNDRLFDNKCWAHDNFNSRALYYGYNSWFKYGFIVNASTEGQTFNQMIFGSLTSVGDSIPYDWIDYETEFQLSRHFPFYDTDRFWITPEYRENKWDFNVPTCETGLGTEGYEEDSNMRGIWMKTLIVYKGNSLKFVGDIISKNIVSNS